ncbi:site-specific integrase [Candidatus Methylospira mobilis]|uniref:tyrosine-type recombinase/integrase n=1 Tax=Candidatus Methylospira mobilis TaxID=1808979 RepID=UPI0028F069F6|nr:site-specific integrase [Candidatus Methylospira mobilis]WNV04104.1 site-specific integrase [Candidatus Methylospira mobilis]
MDTHFSFTKPLLEAIPFATTGERIIYHDTHKSAGGLQLRVTVTSKTFFIQKRVNGRPERVTLGKFPDMTIEQARKETAKVNATIAGGESVATAKRAKREELTLHELFDEYMLHAEAKNKRPDKPKDTFRLYLTPWAKRKLSSIKHDEVRKLHAKIGREKGKVTANIVLKLLHVMFNKGLTEWRIIKGDNPAHGIKKFPEQSRDRFLQADELPRFFEALGQEENTTIRDYVLISLLTGARKTNVLEMQWREISFERMEWRIPTTKNSTAQTITLAPEAVVILRERQGCCDTWVFPGDGRTGHLVEPKKAWARILERANIEDLHIHDLRRSLGSWQAKTGASLSIIGKSLNHKSVNTTAIYARLDLDPVRDSVNRATSAMFEAGGMNKETAEVTPFNQARG